MLSRKVRFIGYLVLALSALFMSGCIKIEVIDRTPSAFELTPVAKEKADQHNLAILAVEFDPPLVYEELIKKKNNGEGVTLLVAVENTGLNTEQNVNVDVSLSTAQGTRTFLQKAGEIKAIAPGEIKVLHFKDTDIPFSYEYQLQVRVRPVAGEAETTDNQKDYDLVITQP